MRPGAMYLNHPALDCFVFHYEPLGNYESNPHIWLFETTTTSLTPERVIFSGKDSWVYPGLAPVQDDFPSELNLQRVQRDFPCNRHGTEGGKFGWSDAVSYPVTWAQGSWAWPWPWRPWRPWMAMDGHGWPWPWRILLGGPSSAATNMMVMTIINGNHQKLTGTIVTI